MTSFPSTATVGSEEPAALFIRDTVQWLERAVIGLNLCPFAKGVHVKGQIHYAVALTGDLATILEVLRSELAALAANPSEVRDTTLLILPHCLHDFLDFNDFLEEAEAVLEEVGMEGTLQIASFHPRFQFAGTREDDVTNCTNRSPYPTLHLLREESIDRAVEVFPEAETIFERNIEVLQELGMSGWAALSVGPGASLPAPPAVKDTEQGPWQ
ncbi:MULTISPECIES: DUF1415 domain-containing protein [unclassified Acidovorax]|uniref:DUF1415 domain-containing protein n=1 Tax=unclassified Acidovorax TaxID=2684926 RepID=UPI001C47F49D|nr:MULTISPECIES: DUF1415 domain-containing protein [unclassified Acidovorax]MBV7428503.1 DUF1415 domain-containing protein [Acidovorax sp. sif0732]MBV7450329.1 DUF1415 domain-containing protein [Acidovorax sp. sif0715]